MSEIFKVGDKVNIVHGFYSPATGVVSKSYGDGEPAVRIENRDDTHTYRAIHESNMELVVETITFEQALERFMPYLPLNTSHTTITDRLRLYRSGSNYLSIEIDKLDLSVHDAYPLAVASKTAQVHFQAAFDIIDEHEAALKAAKPVLVNVALEDIAEKFNITVEQLRIKE